MTTDDCNKLITRFTTLYTLQISDAVNCNKLVFQLATLIR